MAKMKMTELTYAKLAVAIFTVVELQGKTIEQIITEYTSVGMSHTRALWDLYHFACKQDPNIHQQCYNKEMLNDAHIETALKRIAREDADNG